MSWVVEESENTSAISVNDDTVTCTKGSYNRSQINVMYKDPADNNGQYFWQFEYQELDSESSGIVSIGLTTQRGFRAGSGLTAMKYSGDLSDGSAHLKEAFGDRIKHNDKVGLLLQLSDEDLKIYIFHNGRPLGLAFDVQSPYPKPLYPVVSLRSHSQVKISRSQEIPTSLNRELSQFTGVEGTWKITDYFEHPECVGVQFEIKHQNLDTYRLHSHIVSDLNCTLEHYPSKNQWQSSLVLSTQNSGSPGAMKKERLVSELIYDIQRLNVEDGQQLVIQTNNAREVRAERFAIPGPQPLTKNIFN